MTDGLRRRGPRVYGEEDPLFGTLETDGGIRAVFFRTPPHRIYLTSLTEEEAEALAARLAAAGRIPSHGKPQRARRWSASGTTAGSGGMSPPASILRLGWTLRRRRAMFDSASWGDDRYASRTSRRPQPCSEPPEPAAGAREGPPGAVPGNNRTFAIDHDLTAQQAAALIEFIQYGTAAGFLTVETSVGGRLTAFNRGRTGWSGR